MGSLWIQTYRLNPSKPSSQESRGFNHGSVKSAAMGSITGARQMTMTAISHIQGRPCGRLLPMRMCCAFRSGRAATGAAASPGGCRAVGFRPCYKTSIDDANRIG